MTVRPWPLLLLCGAGWVGGCGAAEQPFVGELALLDDMQLVVVEGRDGALSAVAAATGATRWRFVAPPVSHPSFVSMPTRYLVCPIERTAAGALLLRYHTRLLAVDCSTGRELWRRDLSAWATLERRCPKPTADSGVLLLRGDGLFLQKLDRLGRDEWRVSLGRLGAAVAPVLVSLPSGDVLLRTRDHVASVGPSGKVNWFQRR